MTCIDSHAHLTCASVYPAIEELLMRARQAGVAGIVNICTDLDTLEKGLALAKNHSWIVNAAATTPHDVDQQGEAVFPTIKDCAGKGLLAAIGETGLDYYYQHSPKEIQKTFLRRYLHLALECTLPVVIHCREAFKDLFEIIDQEYRNGQDYGPGVLHCFTGTLQEAEEVLKRGLYLSFSGIATFKKSAALREAAHIAPLNQLLIETDTPYLAPQAHRGKMNEPSFLPEIARTIAEAKKAPLEEVLQVTSANAKKLFHF